MTAPDKIWATVGYIGKHDTRVRGEFDTEPSEKAIPYVPLALAQAAVAAAYEAAAQVARLNRPAPAGGPFSHTTTTRVVALDIEAGICALATPDQIAALAAERATTVTVKPLVWAKHPSADIWRCDTMIGTYKVFGGMPSWDFDSATDAKDKTSNTSTRAKLAQAAAQADYDARIRSAITITSGASPDTIPLPRAEVEALMEAARAAWDEACANHEKKPPIKYLAPYGGLVRLHTALATLQERMK